jgi:hypothetical protein
MGPSGPPNTDEPCLLGSGRFIAEGGGNPRCGFAMALEAVSTLTRSESNEGSILVDLGDVRGFSKDCRGAKSWAYLPPNAVSEGCDSVSNMVSE